MVQKKKKYSFDPISSHDAEILILGSLPGDRSLAENEYYAHPSNRFWKVIAHLTQSEIPTTYPDKKELLIKHKIAVWDVAHSAKRKGSMDSEMRDEKPNDILGFLKGHPNIKCIAFNGKKSHALFSKYVDKSVHKKYVELPSTSPANASYTLEMLVEIWNDKLKFQF